MINDNDTLNNWFHFTSPLPTMNYAIYPAPVATPKTDWTFELSPLNRPVWIWKGYKATTDQFWVKRVKPWGRTQDQNERRNIFNTQWQQHVSSAINVSLEYPSSDTDAIGSQCHLHVLEQLAVSALSSKFFNVWAKYRKSYSQRSTLIESWKGIPTLRGYASCIDIWSKYHSQIKDIFPRRNPLRHPA